MAYTKFNDPWQNLPSHDTPIQAEALDHIEDGIVDSAANADTALAENVTQDGRLDGIDADQITQDGRLDGLDAEQITQDVQIAAADEALQLHYGQIDYANTTGHPVVGTGSYQTINPASTLGRSLLFASPAPGQLRYTNDTRRTFRISWSVELELEDTSTPSYALFINGSEYKSETRTSPLLTGTRFNWTGSGLVVLDKNDVVDLRISQPASDTSRVYELNITVDGWRETQAQGLEVTIVWESSVVNEVAWPGTEQVGDVALLIADFNSGDEPPPKTGWVLEAWGRDNAYGVGVYSRVVDGADPPLSSADGWGLSIFRGATVGATGSRGDVGAAGPNYQGTGTTTNPTIPTITQTTGDGFHWWCCRSNKTIYGPGHGYTSGGAFPSGTYYMGHQPADLPGSYGGEQFSVNASVSANNGLVSVALNSAPATLDPAQIEFTFTPTIINAAPPGNDLDFVLYSSANNQYFPVAPFAYGDLGFDGTFVQPATTDYEILAPTGMDLGPHYLLEEPVNGQIRYTGADNRTARLDTLTEIEITQINTDIKLAVYKNGLLVWERGGSFQGNQQGTSIVVPLAAIININQNDTIDIRIDTTQSCEVSLHSIMFQAWPTASGELP